MKNYKWINTKKLLPENEEHVMIIAHDLDDPYISTAFLERETKEWVILGSGREGIPEKFFKFNEIKFWRNLPKLPKSLI